MPPPTSCGSLNQDEQIPNAVVPIKRRVFPTLRARVRIPFPDPTKRTRRHLHFSATGDHAYVRNLVGFPPAPPGKLSRFLGSNYICLLPSTEPHHASKTDEPADNNSNPIFGVRSSSLAAPRHQQTGMQRPRSRARQCVLPGPASQQTPIQNE